MITEEIFKKAVDLYENQKISMWNLSKQLGLRYNDIRKAFKKNKVKVRKNGESKKITNPELDSKIVEGYINKESIRELSIKYDIDRSVIDRILREKQIIKRTIHNCNKKKEFDEQYVVKQYLAGISTVKLAEELNTTSLTLCRLLRRNSIKIRNHGHEHHFHTKHKFSPEIEMEIINKYIKDDFSCNQLGKDYKTSHSVIINILKRHNIPMVKPGIKNQIYEINQNYFENINSPEAHLLFGIILTDGSIKIKDCKYTLTLELQAEDKPTIEFLRNSIGSTHPIYYIKSKNSYAIGICNKKIANDLNSLGAMPNKTYLLKYPTCVNNDLLSHFFHGCIIGDGWISNTGNSPFTVGVTGLENMIDEFKERIYKATGISGCKAKCSDGDITFQLTFTNFQAIKICNFIFKNAPFLMKRKYELYEDFVITRFNDRKLVRYSHNYETIKEAMIICEENKSKKYW